MTAITYALNVDWDGDGTCESNEASRFLSGRTHRGRDGYVQPGGDGFVRADPGEATLILDNADGRFDPYNTGSAIYPNIKPGRLVELKATIGASTYWLFHGWIDDIIPEGVLASRKVRMVVKDGWRWLMDREARVVVKANRKTDECIGDVLDAVDWPSAMGRSLATGSDSLAYWWAENDNGAKLINDLAESELGAVFVAADGKLTFASRQGGYNGTSALTLTAADLSDLLLPRPWQQTRNIIRVKAYPPKALTGVEIFRLNEIPLIPLGQSLTLYADFSLYDGTPLAATAITAAVAYVAPVEGSTPDPYDYRANVAEDNSGADCSASVSLVITLYAETAKIVVTNNGTVDCYVTELRLRGNAIDNSAAATVEVEDATSKAEYGPRVQTVDLPWQQSVWIATDFANWLKSWLKNPLAFPAIALKGIEATQLAWDLHTRLTLTVAGVGIDADFTIGEIDHEIPGAQAPIKTKWRLEPVDQTVYWQFTTAIGTTSRFGY